VVLHLQWLGTGWELAAWTRDRLSVVSNAPESHRLHTVGGHAAVAPFVPADPLFGDARGDDGVTCARDAPFRRRDPWISDAHGNRVRFFATGQWLKHPKCVGRARTGEREAVVRSKTGIHQGVAWKGERNAGRPRLPVIDHNTT
jgi:hypothetical protein